MSQVIVAVVGSVALPALFTLIYREAREAVRDTFGV
ncbi:hypothetical protein JDBV08_00735 [Mycobacterium phage jiawei]|nr:hypothetical protein JDBV08_00735 [Mycobacterium phage jiawei]